MILRRWFKLVIAATSGSFLCLSGRAYIEHPPGGYFHAIGEFRARIHGRRRSSLWTSDLTGPGFALNQLFSACLFCCGARPGTGPLFFCNGVSFQTCLSRARFCRNLRACGWPTALFVRHRLLRHNGWTLSGERSESARMMGWTPPGFVSASLCLLASCGVGCQHSTKGNPT